MYLLIKRCFDFIFAVMALIIFLPLMVVVALAIKLTSRGPVFYLGSRTGLYGQPFKMLKFRSMVVDADLKGGPSTTLDDPRFTSIGRIIRKYKLDELPQLINVILGHMSLVGPRPQVKHYTDLYKGDEHRMLSMKPGITDLASLYFSDMDAILGTGDVDSYYLSNIEPIKNKLRIRYVHEATFALDMKILIETGLKIFGMNRVFDLGL